MTGKFNTIIKVIERDKALDQDLYDRAEKVFGKDVESIRAALQHGIERSNEAIAILAKADEEQELQYFHGYFEDGTGATLCLSKAIAEHRVAERGGYVLSRPKPEPFTVVS